MEFGGFGPHCTDPFNNFIEVQAIDAVRKVAEQVREIETVVSKPGGEVCRNVTDRALYGNYSWSNENEAEKESSIWLQRFGMAVMLAVAGGQYIYYMGLTLLSRPCRRTKY